MRSTPSIRHGLSAVFLAAACASFAGCTGSVAVDPDAYGQPPEPENAQAQVRAHVAEKLQGREPANVTCGPAKKAYHAKLSAIGGKLLWQGYAVPVVMDVNTADGRRIHGRRYAAMFTGGRMVGMVDYPGSTNSKGVLGFFWDDGSAPTVKVSHAQEAQATQTAQAKPAPKSWEQPMPLHRVDDTLIDPLAIEPAPSRPAPGKPAAAPQAEAKTWAPLAGMPALGTKVYLASDKSYVGMVADYEDLHAFGDNTVKPAVRVRYATGAMDWFSMKVAGQVYVVQAAK